MCFPPITPHQHFWSFTKSQLAIYKKFNFQSNHPRSQAIETIILRLIFHIPFLFPILLHKENHLSQTRRRRRNKKCQRGLAANAPMSISAIQKGVSRALIGSAALVSLKTGLVALLLENWRSKMRQKLCLRSWRRRRWRSRRIKKVNCEILDDVCAGASN